MLCSSLEHHSNDLPWRSVARVIRIGVGGRLALMVWRSLQHNPGFQAVVEAVERHCGRGAASTVRTAFALDDPDELGSLVLRAGFADFGLHTVRRRVSFPSPEMFVQRYDAGSPLQHAVARLPDERRRVLINEVRSALRLYMADGTVRFPMEAHLVRAQKPDGEGRGPSETISAKQGAQQKPHPLLCST